MLKPKNKDMEAGEFIILLGVVFFLIASAIRGGYMFIRDFINLF